MEKYVSVGLNRQCFKSAVRVLVLRPDQCWGTRTPTLLNDPKYGKDRILNWSIRMHRFNSAKLFPIVLLYENLKLTIQEVCYRQFA